MKRHGRKIGSSKPSPFPTPSPLTICRLTSIVKLAQITFSRQWNPGTGGNFSVVDDAAGVVWQSPSGLMKGELAPNLFLPLEKSSAKPIRPCSAKPSDESPLHAMIYRIDPEARAVIHVHSPWTLIKARSGKLEFAQQEMQKALGLKTHDAELRIPVFPNTQEMESFARDLEGASWDRQGKLFILKDHGVYGWGREPEEAFCRIEALEFLCQTN